MLGRDGSAVSRLQTATVVLLLLVAASGLAYLSFYRPNGSSSQNETAFSTSASMSATTSTTTSTTASPTSSATSSLRIGNASWLTYHANNARTGVDKTIQSFGSVRLAWKSTPFDGAIYAEPLVIGDTVIAATENNSIYSVDAGSGNVVWRTNLGEPVPRSDLPCGNIDPTGITGTPSIDLASKTVYVVGFLRPPHHELFALNLRNGSVRFHHSADPATSDPLVQQQRGALTVANGFVYVPYGGLLGDCGAYYGWIVGMRTDGTGKLVDFKVPTGRAGGIWAPSGAAVDESGNLFVATGNSYSTDNFDFGESVIKLSPSLKLADWFAPSDWSSLNADDRDLGSVGPTFLDSTTLFQIGKEGMGYLLNPERLGMIGGQQFSAKVCNAAFGGTAYSQPLLFVPCVDGLVALSVKLGSSPSFNVAWRGPAFNAGPPIVAGGAVWTVDIAGGTLYSLSLGDGHVLFKSSLGGVAHFCTPASGGRRVYVAANDQVIAFALNP